MRTVKFILLWILLTGGITISAEEFIDSIETRIRNLSLEEQVTVLSNLSWELRERETKKALTYGKRAVQLADSLELSQKLGRASNNVGVILLHYQYKPKEAVPYLHTALELALKNNDSLNIAYAYNNLGDVYYLSGNSPLAHNFTDKSMEYASALNDSTAIAYSHVNYGLVSLLDKKYDKALEHLFKAIDIRKNLGHKIGIASANQQVGFVYYEMGSYNKAMEFFKIAYEQNKQIDNKRWMSFGLDGMGNVLYKFGDYGKAISDFKKSLELNLSSNHIYGVIDNKLGMALVYSKTNQADLGKKLLDEALKYSKELGLPIKLMETYKTFINFYLNVGNIEAAKKSMQDYDNIYDSLYSASQFETLWELQKSSAINRKLKESEHELAIKKLQNDYFIIIIFLLVVLAVVIFWRYFSNRKLTQQLKASNDAKEQLFSIISHDLRNPFFSLMGYISMLKDNQLEDYEKKQCIEDLDLTTKNTYSLLENLLNLSQSRTRNIECSPSQIPIMPLLNSLIKNIEPQLRKKDIKIKLDVKHDEIFADESMLQIILRNLLTNAIKYSFEGGEIILKSKIKNNNYCLTIADTGQGMDHETVKNLFASEFVQSEHGTLGEKGTGIGLRLCKEFIDKHHGTLTVKSKVNKGSEFTFCLPNQN